MKVVISQSMFFPWVGFLEQIRLADTYVFYDDVQFSKGSFINRVQIKTVGGSKWMTVPLAGHELGQAIEQVHIKPTVEWKNKHLALLKQSLAGLPLADEALALASSVYDKDHANLGSLARDSLMTLADYFGLVSGTRFVDISELGVDGHSSQRVFDAVTAVGGTEYITGHGAKDYLAHELFEDAGVRVKYMRYECREYPQQHGEFTPYVSALDLVANCGKSGIDYIASQAIDWRDFLHESD